MCRRRILVIEDEKKTAASIRLYLEQAGYEVAVEHDGRRGLEEARRRSWHLVILDLMLPGMDGQSICRALRAESDVPILMLTARTTPAERVEGLEMGADDYVPKPFSLRELAARVRAILKRTDLRDGAGPARFRFGDLEVDLERRDVRSAGRPVGLTPTEFDLLAVFVRAPGRVFSRDVLVEQVLGPDYEGMDRTVDVHVKNLRKKIEPERPRPTYIKTVFGIGYRFDPDLEDPGPESGR